MSRSFRLAPMSPLIKGMTIAAWFIPIVLGVIAVAIARSIPWVALMLSFTVLFFLLSYAAVWFGCRPTRFVVKDVDLEIVFPLWRRKVPLQDVVGVRIIDQDTFRQEFGLAIRVGVGGLWGGFGWLLTQRRGRLEFYISRIDEFILLERRSQNNLLITPEHPEAFVEVLQAVR